MLRQESGFSQEKGIRDPNDHEQTDAEQLTRVTERVLAILRFHL